MTKGPFSSIALDNWPDQDRELWRAAKEPNDPLEEPGKASTWRPATIKMTEYNYGSFLAWQQERGQLDIDRRPIDRVNKEVIEAFIKDYCVGRSELTVAGAVRGVAYVLRATHPPDGLPWLTKLCHRMTNTAKPSKSKVGRMATLPELFDLADALMKAGKSDFEPAFAG